MLDVIDWTIGVVDAVGGVLGGVVDVVGMGVEDVVGGLSIFVDVGITKGMGVVLVLVDVVEGV